MATSQKPPVVAIVGATASGKSGLAITLAQHFAGEVISADSRQVYRGLDIGTAKVTDDETQGIPHHLIDVLSLPATYTAHDFVRDATTTIAAIHDRDHLPIIAGGTFFYLDLLFKKTSAAPVPPDPQLRAELATKSTAELYEQLRASDPERADTIDAQNPRRLIRALEIAASLGQNPSHTKADNPYRTLILGIYRDRDSLRDRYATRAQEWLTAGIIDETQHLLDQGITRERIQELGFEYTLVLELIDGQLDQSEWQERFVQKNWQYAKRQLTWLRRDQDIQWINADDKTAAITTVQAFLASQ